ncbi:MAG: OmpH family outer membrane protein [Bacteroidales bacterium]|nr:OmpH family outer membrane protein [Bacteroidales bacterium]
MEINLEKQEVPMYASLPTENITQDEKTESTEPDTTPVPEKTESCGCQTPPRRPRCCWVTVGFIAAFAAIIALFILFFTQKGGNAKENKALNALMQNGETPYILTVNNDSIVAQFVLVDILTKDLEEETTRYQKELQSKQSALEEKYSNYQINVQNQVLTKTQMQNAEKQLTQEAAALKTLQEKYATILAGKQASVQKEIADSIINVTTRINEKKYHAKYVMATSTGSALIYTSPEYDITEEVIAELNRTYGKSHGN